MKIKWYTFRLFFGILSCYYLQILAEYNSQIMHKDNHEEEDCLTLEGRNFMGSYRSLFFER